MPQGWARRLARLYMFYMVKNNEYNHNAYFIHGHYVMLDHYPIQLEICIRSETSRKPFLNRTYPNSKRTLEMKLGLGGTV